MDLPGHEGHDHNNMTMEEELLHAALEKRQPLCIYCRNPLQIAQRVEEQIVWYWNPLSGAYEKLRTLLVTLEQPYCVSCQTPDPVFVNNSWVHY